MVMIPGEQPVPESSRADVERVTRREFAEGEFMAILEILDEYGRESWERETSRVQLAILKLADGDLDALMEYLSVAKKDYRDVLAWAEYPTYLSRTTPGQDLSENERQELYSLDWKQYSEWLWRQ